MARRSETRTGTYETWQRPPLLLSEQHAGGSRIEREQVLPRHEGRRRPRWQHQAPCGHVPVAAVKVRAGHSRIGCADIQHEDPLLATRGDRYLHVEPIGDGDGEARAHAARDGCVRSSRLPGALVPVPAGLDPAARRGLHATEVRQREQGLAGAVLQAANAKRVEAAEVSAAAALVVEQHMAAGEAAGSQRAVGVGDVEFLHG